MRSRVCCSSNLFIQQYDVKRTKITKIYIIGGNNLNDIIYVYKSMLMADSDKIQLDL